MYAERKPKDPDAFSMTVMGAGFHEKKAAGEAVIEACKAADCTEQTVKIGKYCGLAMTLRFDAFSKMFEVNLKNKLFYLVTVGTDASGNVTRINNALRRMPLELQAARDELDTLNRQMGTAKEELKKSFPQEAELAEKEKCLNALNALLSWRAVNRSGNRNARKTGLNNEICGHASPGARRRRAGAGGVMTDMEKRSRPIYLHVMVDEREKTLIDRKMK